MIVVYARMGSYRAAARLYGVDFKTLQRHITQCVYAVMEEVEEREFRKYFNQVSQMLIFEFTPLPKKPPRSIITKPIKYTWSRRSWGKNGAKLDKSVK